MPPMNRGFEATDGRSQEAISTGRKASVKRPPREYHKAWSDLFEQGTDYKRLVEIKLNARRRRSRHPDVGARSAVSCLTAVRTKP